MAKGPAATETRHLRTLFALGAAETLTDGQLLERFATGRGDPAELAFAALVERHGPMVLRAARATLRDEHSARDAFQATFLILARKARSLWVRDSLGPWLHSVARRVALEARSAEARRRRVEASASRPEAFVPDDRPGDDLARVLDEEIGRLPPRYWLAVVACHLEGLTQHEAAAQLGWPVGTLQSRLARGRLRLRDRLQRRGLAPSLVLLSGKLAPIPPALIASTARAALAVAPGGKVAGLVATAVLGLLETTTKGMLMTKLKLGTLALVMTCGIVGSGVGLSLQRPAVATDLASQAKVGGDNAKPEATPAVLNQGDAIPPPTDGPGFPQMLEFYDPVSFAGQKLHEEYAALARRGYPIKSFDTGVVRGGLTTPGEVMAQRYQVYSCPQIVLVDDKGDEIDRLANISAPAQIAAFFNANRSGTPKTASTVPTASGSQPVGEDEPGLTDQTRPKPWETAVRVKILPTDESSGIASGVVIWSVEGESFLLTTAHNLHQTLNLPTLFRGEKSILPEPKGRIEVDLFDGRLTGEGKGPCRVTCIARGIPAKLMGYDVLADLALLSIDPGRILPASPLVDGKWRPLVGMRMVALGCSNGNDATAWDTTIIDPAARFSRPGPIGFCAPGEGELPAFVATFLKCFYEPKPGRDGGGLYTPDGALAGICSLADPDRPNRPLCDHRRGPHVPRQSRV